MFILQEKENLDYAKELRKAEIEYEKKRERLQIHYGMFTTRPNFTIYLDIRYFYAPMLRGGHLDLPLSVRKLKVFKDVPCMKPVPMATNRKNLKILVRLHLVKVKATRYCLNTYLTINALTFNI